MVYIIKDTVLISLFCYCAKSIALYTTPAQFPWYRAVTPLTLTLPPRGMNDEESRKKFKFTYRYAIYSGGVFSRWEQPSDGPDIDPYHGDDGDIAMSDSSLTSSSTNRLSHHEIPLHQMQHSETYVVSNVLGVTWIPSDKRAVHHIRKLHHCTIELTVARECH
jgi:hypothetical protein